MGLGKTFTSVAVAMICKLLTERVVIGLPLTIVWGNTLAERLNMVQNNFPGIIGKERERYPLWRHNAVPCCLIEIQKTPQQGHAVLISALKCILVVRMPRDAETFKIVIDEMTYATNFKPLNLLHAEDANLTYEDLNTSLDEPENRSNIHRVPCSVSNGSSFVPDRFYRSAWQRPYPIINRRFFKRTITLWLQILIREFSVWYIKYVASYGASFGRLRFWISSNLSKR